MKCLIPLLFLVFPVHADSWDSFKSMIKDKGYAEAGLALQNNYPDSKLYGKNILFFGEIGIEHKNWSMFIRHKSLALTSRDRGSEMLAVKYRF